MIEPMTVVEGAPANGPLGARLGLRVGTRKLSPKRRYPIAGRPFNFKPLTERKNIKNP